jgi:hypothetical protein
MDSDIVLVRRSPTNAFDEMVLQLARQAHSDGSGVCALFQFAFICRGCTPNKQRNAGLFIARPGPMCLAVFEAAEKIKEEVARIGDQGAVNRALKWLGLTDHASGLLSPQTFVSVRGSITAERKNLSMPAWEALALAGWPREHGAQFPFTIHLNGALPGTKVDVLRRWHLWYGCLRRGPRRATDERPSGGWTTTRRAKRPA